MLHTKWTLNTVNKNVADAGDKLDKLDAFEIFSSGFFNPLSISSK